MKHYQISRNDIIQGTFQAIDEVDAFNQLAIDIGYTDWNGAALVDGGTGFEIVKCDLEDLPDGWQVYKGEDAFDKEMHEEHLWYFEPSDWDTGEVYSEGYTSLPEAVAGCLRAVIDLEQ